MKRFNDFLRRIAKKPKTSVFAGIDIRDGQLVLTVLRRQASEYQCLKYRIVPLTSVDPETGLPDQAELTATIKSIWPKKLVKSGIVSVSINPPNTLLRTFVFPKGSRDQIDRRLAKKVAHFVLFSGKSTEYTWEVIEELVESGEKKVKVLAAISEKSTIDLFLTAFKKAGVGVKTLTVSPIASFIGAVDGALKSQAGGRQIYVDMDTVRTTIFVLERKKITYVYSEKIGAADIVSDDKKADTLRDDIDKIRALYTEENAITKVVYHVTDPAGTEFFKSIPETLKIGVESASGTIPKDVFDKIQGQCPIVSMSSLGLARGDGLSVNFIPEADLKLQLREAMVFLTAYMIVTSVIVGVVYLSLFVGTRLVERRITKVKTELTTSQVQYTKVVVKDRKIKSVKQLIDSRRQIIKKHDRTDWALVFLELPNLLNNNIRFDKLEVTGGTHLLVEGHARSSDDIFYFIRQLKLSPHWQHINLEQVFQKKKTNLFYFKIQGLKKQRASL